MSQNTHMIQVWPSGRGYEYQGDPLVGGQDGPQTLRTATYNGEKQEAFRCGFPEEWANIRAELLAQRYLDREVLKCDSMLVNDLFAGTECNPEEWDRDNIDNLYPDPSDWDAEQCYEALADHGIGAEEDDDIDELRQLVTDHAEPAEIFEWWAVTEWLAEELRAIGQPVLDNAYGYWWGRTCTGQGILMDGTLQAIARKHD